MYYLGIDGGGTRTTAVVTDEKGNIITKKTGGTINFYSVGNETARNNLADIMNEITAETGIKSFASAFIGCSALDCEADEEATDALCKGVINAEKIKMHSDVYIALKSTEDAECPCVAICGTGSIAAAEDNDGSIHVSGGWGHIIGDEGSAYSIAVTALKICCQMCDKGEKTHLLDSANKFFGTDDFRKTIDIIYSPDMTKDRLARFAEALDINDEMIRRIIKIEAQKFAFTVQTLLEKMINCDVLGLYGGVFQHNSLFREEFTQSVRNNFPELKIQLIETPPEETAALLARNL
ncbi:MAG: hypothetical protein IJ289_04055 [Clostridia bacterium]|nr:hypothetical protein [Clostridia bacterium]